MAATALRVVILPRRFPKVARSSQPWAKATIPLGLFASERDSISSRYLAFENPNGITLEHSAKMVGMQTRHRKLRVHDDIGVPVIHSDGAQSPRWLYRA